MLTHPRRHAARAFTLIELLVVIGIIALLISILLPTLSRARESARNVQCLSNLRQVAVAGALYEGDNGRLPQHYAETLWDLQLAGGTAPTFAWADQIMSNGLDLRDQWFAYIDGPENISCPFLEDVDMSFSAIPPWQPSDPPRRVYVDYFLFAGFYSNSASTNGPFYPQDPSAQLWTKTSQKWTIGDRRYRVLAGDRLFQRGSTFGIRYASHPGDLGSVGVQTVSSPASEVNRSLGYMNYDATATPDVLDQAEGNFALTDGSARSYEGDAEDMAQLKLPVDFGGVGASTSARYRLPWAE